MRSAGNRRAERSKSKGVPGETEELVREAGNRAEKKATDQRRAEVRRMMFLAATGGVRVGPCRQRIEAGGRRR